ncbi:hypothetical protein KBD61_05195 [Patescibacteria group bacterium]|nr:hypothetical protein [Patescibacteria group bacterium]MBP9710387.1 hypothetical protein [Patescibacteria group bacterium]
MLEVHKNEGDKRQERPQTPDQVIKDFLAEWSGRKGTIPPELKGVYKYLEERQVSSPSSRKSAKILRGFLDESSGEEDASEKLRIVDATIAYEVEHRDQWQSSAGGAYEVYSIALDAHNAPLTRRAIAAVPSSKITDGYLAELRKKKKDPEQQRKLIDLFYLVYHRRDVREANEVLRAMTDGLDLAKIDLNHPYLNDPVLGPFVVNQMVVWRRANVDSMRALAERARGEGNTVVRGVVETAIDYSPEGKWNRANEVASMVQRIFHPHIVNKGAQEDGEARKALRQEHREAMLQYVDESFKGAHIDRGLFEAEFSVCDQSIDYRGGEVPHVWVPIIKWPVLSVEMAGEKKRESIESVQEKVEEYVWSHRKGQDDVLTSLTAGKVAEWSREVEARVFQVAKTDAKDVIAQKFKREIERRLTLRSGLLLKDDYDEEDVKDMGECLAAIRRGIDKDRQYMEAFEVVEWLEGVIRQKEEFVERRGMAFKAARMQEKKAEREEEKEGRKERRGSMQKEYLGELVGFQADYLQNVYEVSLGTDLGSLPGFGREEDSGAMATVSLSPRLGMSMRTELVQRLEPERGIFVEMGEDLETAKRRMAMVDWVVPHEIGHLVQEAEAGRYREQRKEHPIKNFEKQMQHALRVFASIGKGNELMKNQVSECYIDGIGYGMAASFGVSDPRMDTREKRIQASIRALASAMQEVRLWLTKKSSVEAKFIPVLMRQIAIAEIVIQELDPSDPLIVLVQGSVHEHAATLENRWHHEPLLEIAKDRSHSARVKEVFGQAFLAGKSLNTWEDKVE